LVAPWTGRVLGGFATLQGSRRDPLVRFSIFRPPSLAAAGIRDRRTQAQDAHRHRNCCRMLEGGRFIAAHRALRPRIRSISLSSR
jgi:hypothetical protein